MRATNKYNLLIYEPKVELGALIYEYFQSVGCDKPIIVQEEKDVITTFNTQKYDAIVLNVTNKLNVGYNLLKEIRETDKDVFVFIIGNDTEIKRKKEFFELGADDYMTYPYNLMLLMARILSKLNRFHR